MAGMMGQFILLTRRQIKPGGAPKRSFVSYQPNVRFAPKADMTEPMAIRGSHRLAY